MPTSAIGRTSSYRVGDAGPLLKSTAFLELTRSPRDTHERRRPGTHGLTFNGETKDPTLKAVRDALIAFMASTAEAQAGGHKGGPKRWHRVRQG
jgi:hypothetical protein